MIKGKKGAWIARSLFFYLVWGFITLPAMAAGFLYYVNIDTMYDLNVPKSLEAIILEYRFTHSSDCFLADQYFKVVVDWDKLTQDQMDNCYTVPKDSPIIAYRLRVSTVAGDEKVVKSANWNDELGAKKIKSPRTIVITKDNKVIDGALKLEMQNV